MPTKTLLAAGWLAAAAHAGVPTAPALAPDEPPPCEERWLRSARDADGVWHVYRIRPRPGTSCAMALTRHADAAERGIAVIERPRHGRLLAVRRGRIVYRAARSGARDIFAVVLATPERPAGSGDRVHIAVIVEPRR